MGRGIYGDNFGASGLAQNKHYLKTENLIKEESSEENQIVTEDENENERERRKRKERAQNRALNEGLSVSPKFLSRNTHVTRNNTVNSESSYNELDRSNLARTPLLEQYNQQYKHITGNGRHPPVGSLAKVLKESSTSPLEN